MLARAERDRQAAAREERRQQLLRKELAWLRRGPPARTSKPKFRIEAANALIADEPEPRDRAELLRFATARLGDKVLDAEDVSLAYGDAARPARRHLAARPGRPRRARRRQRLGQDDADAAARAASWSPTRGAVERGATVRLALLSQDTAEIPGRPARARVARGGPRPRDARRRPRDHRRRCCASASASAARRARTLVRDLSGGERRRLQLMRLLMGEPNVLLLDEPTNDLDIDTLTALEDLLDGWPGTLVVVSHDRYFVERVCDDVYALAGDGGIRHLPGGIEQYLELRRARGRAARRPPRRRARGAPPARRRRARGAQGGRAARARAREARRARGGAARGDGGAGDRPRAPARAPGRAGRARRRARRLEAAWLETSEVLEA